jgi:hypothetical protein
VTGSFFRSGSQACLDHGPLFPCGLELSLRSAHSSCGRAIQPERSKTVVAPQFWGLDRSDSDRGMALGALEEPRVFLGPNPPQPAHVLDPAPLRGLRRKALPVDAGTGSRERHSPPEKSPRRGLGVPLTIRLFDTGWREAHCLQRRRGHFPHRLWRLHLVARILVPHPVPLRLGESLGIRSRPLRALA